MKYRFNMHILLFFIILIFMTSGALAGTIKGSVKVKGLRSPENILVYLTLAPQVTINLTQTKFVMDQQNLTFIPHVLPVPVGATVQFPNSDKVAHNVFSLSRTKQFNLGSYNPGATETVVFDKPGIVELRCDVHAEMTAYIMVMKNPYFAVTDKNGNFMIPDPTYLKKLGISEIPELPAGKYTIKTRHEKLKTDKQPVAVPEQGAVAVQFTLERGTPSVLYK